MSLGVCATSERSGYKHKFFIGFTICLVQLQMRRLRLLPSGSGAAPVRRQHPCRIHGQHPPRQVPSLRYDPAGPDRNCSRFDTWQEANAFFLAAGGPNSDPHRLDANSDGVPCENLSGAP